MLQRHLNRQPITVAILTKNEEALVARAVASARWADEVLVVDSESSDATREIAERAGARVVVQPWLGWLGQHRRAVDLASHDWVMKLDADEIITERLAASIRDALDGDPDPRDGYVVTRVDEFMGALLPDTRRRSRRDAFVRVFNRTMSGWDPDLAIHEEVKVAGRRHKLKGPLLHWRNASIERLIAVYNANSEVEAASMLKRAPEGPSAAAVVLKPVLRFAWAYVWSGSWRFGMRGFHRAVMHAFADYLALAKAWEAKHAPPVRDPRPEQLRALDRIA